jgi:hypothetical protein
MKKQFFKLAGIALIAVAVLGSCKKGENDPLLSLKSRNARITGTWDLVSSDATGTSSNTTGGTTTTDVETTTYNGTTLTNNDNGNISTVSYSQSIDIRKDGTYTMTTVQDGSTSTTVGNWWWLSSKKKKVRIAFDDDFGSLYIDRLKNKEMVLTADSESSFSASGFSSSDVYSATYTFEKQ